MPFFRWIRGIRQVRRDSEVTDLGLCLDGPSALARLLEMPFQTGRFHVPVELCTTRGAFGLAGWHPFVQELREPGTLRRFYARFQPRSLGELYFLHHRQGGAERSPRLLPWFENEFGDYGAAPLEPSTFYGPASPEIIADEEARLPALLASIRAQGFRPDRYGDIGGYVLRRGRELRFFVHGGRHRAVCLAALGQGRIPVRFRRRAPPVVDPADVEDWPFVRRGTVARNVALAVFDRFFDWCGREQAELIFAEPPEAGPV